MTDLSVYPSRGQNATTQRRDRYECNAWAVGESGFDPATRRTVPTPVPRVEADPPSGYGLAAGTVTGAAGNDSLLGENDADRLFGDVGNDTLRGGGGLGRKGLGHGSGS